MQRTLFDEEHDLFRASFRQFVAQEVLPHNEAWEKAGIVDRELFAKAGELGFLGFAAPEEHGGGGVRDFRYNLILGEELQRAGTGAAGLGITLHTDICMPYFLDLTNDEQKARWLPGICSGELITAVAMTEPGAGSDLAGIATTAKRDGDHYVVNGSKTFITNGINADLVITAVKTDPSQRHRGISLVVLERGMPGFERGRNLEKVGLHSQDTAELFFNDVEVPVANLLGEEGKGFGSLMDNLAQERLSIAANGVAAARAAFEWTLEYCKERQAFGQPIGAFQNTPVPPRRDGHRGDGGGVVRRPLRGRAQRGHAHRGGGVGGEDVVHRAAGAHRRPRRAAPRRVRLHARVPDRPRLRRRPHHPHLRRHQRGDARDRRPLARGLSRLRHSHPHPRTRGTQCRSSQARSR